MAGRYACEFNLKELKKGKSSRGVPAGMLFRSPQCSPTLSCP